MERDFDKNPYSPDEAKVAKWLDEKGGMGGGEDPIGFLMVSYDYLVHQRNRIAEVCKKANESGLLSDGCDTTALLAIESILDGSNFT